MHPHMALNIEECVELTHLKEKVTVVIPTRNAGMEFLLWSVFSLLLRSKPGGMLEHICVCINGPDERQGDLSLENLKQQFLEELRDIDWYHADDPKNRRAMPLTVIRVWSRVGYTEVFEMALNWVHTDSYLIMHDDVFLKNSDWTQEVKEKFYDDDQVAIAYTPQLLGCACDHAVHRGMYLLRMPQMQTTFLLCKKKWLMKVGALWRGFHIPSDDNMLQFELEEMGDVDEFEKFWQDQDLYLNPILKTELYNFVRQEVGAWVYYKLFTNNFKFVKLNEDNILHFEGMSLSNVTEDVKNKKIGDNLDDIRKLEELILAHPDYSRLYNKYLPSGIMEK